MRKVLLICFLFVYNASPAQLLFGDRCIGTWKGMMHIFQLGKLRDSVEVKLTVVKDATHVWTDYLVGNKLYSIFETQGVMLTASYELRGEQMIYEVTSGKKETVTHPQVTTFGTTSVQRVNLTRMK
jgi:hypothetical protein